MGQPSFDFPPEIIAYCECKSSATSFNPSGSFWTVFTISISSQGVTGSSKNEKKKKKSKNVGKN